MTEEFVAAIVRSIASSPDEAAFTIYEQDGLKPVGATVIAKIDYRKRTVLYGIEIGEASARQGPRYGNDGPDA